MHWQYRTISRGDNSILHNLNALFGFKTNNYISFYGLSRYGRLGNDRPIVTTLVMIFFFVCLVINSYNENKIKISSILLYFDGGVRA
ncbi:putative phospholipase D [Helianthus debilis subsp. tardiflorus]